MCVSMFSMLTFALRVLFFSEVYILHIYNIRKFEAAWKGMPSGRRFVEGAADNNGTSFSQQAG